MAAPNVLERGSELDRLGVAVQAAARGDGGVVLIQGSAGIGKTELLRATRSMAAGEGLVTLGAAASELDRDFPFGLVHQLFDAVVTATEADRRARLLDGAAARAAGVLDPGSAPAADGDDPGYATLHGLYWLLANLADEGPLALLVDDLHWSDRASLRFLEYAGRRLEGLPAIVVATARPQEPGADADLVSALAAGPAAVVLRPRPLSEEAAATVLAESLGRDPDAAFVGACESATGGNPLLLRVLAREAAAHGLTGTAGEAARAEALGAEGVASQVQRRLRALGSDAVAVAHAVAILGERRRIDELAAVAELEEAAARDAADRLVAAEVLETGGWAFVHPLLREAVVAAIAPAERARLHGIAARYLAAEGARPDEVAAHVLATEPASQPEVVELLRSAARSAVADGAPEVAVTQLRRALSEPPPAEERADVLLELGEAETRAGEPDAALAHLSAALDEGLAGDAAARARATRGTLQLLSDPEPALAEFEQAVADATDPTQRLRFEALLFEASIFHVAYVERRAELLEAARGEPDTSVVALAHLAQHAGYAGAPVAETLDYATRASAGGELLAAIGPENSTFNLLTHGLRYAERADLARGLIDAGEAAARRSGSRLLVLFLDHATSYWELAFGSVATGLARALEGRDKANTAGYAVPAAAFSGIAAEMLHEQDRLEEAVAIVDSVPPEAFGNVGGVFALGSRGLIRRHQHRREEAEADLREAVAALDLRGWKSPLVAGARLWLAELLAEGGSAEEAVAIASACADVARAADLPSALGESLRVQGVATGGDEGIELLEASVEAFERSANRLGGGWAQHDLGAALRRSGRRSDAREPLRGALDAAARTESVRLERMARAEMAAAGGRPRRQALSGPASLTASERRVAELAAGGMSNREIAEQLWVTRKTVEVHLSHAYGKLDIRSRGELAAALAPAEAA